MDDTKSHSVRLTPRRLHILDLLAENADGGDPYMADVSLVELQILSEAGLARHTRPEESLKRAWTITNEGRDARVRAAKKGAA